MNHILEQLINLANCWYYNILQTRFTTNWIGPSNYQPQTLNDNLCKMIYRYLIYVKCGYSDAIVLFPLMHELFFFCMKL